MGEAVVGTVEDALGEKVVTDGEEIEKALDDLSPAAKADIDMMAAAKRKPLHRPASGKNAVPTLSGGGSRAKVEISDENRKGLAEKSALFTEALPKV